MTPHGEGLPGNSPTVGAQSPSAARIFRVLIIDDDEAERELTTRRISETWPFDHEMAPDYARTGREAIEKMRATHYALAVLDWRLPDMDGSEVLRLLRQSHIPTPVIVLSGMCPEAIEKEIELLGVALLNKDEITPESLHQAIAISLRQLGLKLNHAA